MTTNIENPDPYPKVTRYGVKAAPVPWEHEELVRFQLPRP